MIPVDAVTQGLRLELVAEVAAARRVAWILRGLAVSFAVAYLVTLIALRQLDPAYLWLSAGTLLSGGSQFVYLERYRVPQALTRLAAHPTPELRLAVEPLWPEIRALRGREIAALGPRLFALDEISALGLDDALSFIREADRRDWPRFARRWAVALGVMLGSIVLYCALHVPDQNA